MKKFIPILLILGLLSLCGSVNAAEGEFNGTITIHSVTGQHLLNPTDDTTPIVSATYVGNDTSVNCTLYLQDSLLRYGDQNFTNNTVATIEYNTSLADGIHIANLSCTGDSPDSINKSTLMSFRIFTDTVDVTKYRNITSSSFIMLVDIIGVLPDIVDGLMDAVVSILLVLAIIVLFLAMSAFIIAMLTVIMGYIGKLKGR